MVNFVKYDYAMKKTKVGKSRFLQKFKFTSDID